VDCDNLYSKGLDDDGCTMEDSGDNLFTTEDSGDAGLIENAGQEALTSKPCRWLLL
jgi:hypothetical protein